MLALNGGHPSVTTGLDQLLNLQLVALKGGLQWWSLMVALNGGHPPMTTGLDQLLNSQMVAPNGGP
jgi:hypothetical protein